MSSAQADVTSDAEIDAELTARVWVHTSYKINTLLQTLPLCMALLIIEGVGNSTSRRVAAGPTKDLSIPGNPISPLLLIGIQGHFIEYHHDPVLPVLLQVAPDRCMATNPRREHALCVKRIYHFHRCGD